MQRYSFLTLAGRALRGNKGWRPVWRHPEPRSSYEVIVVGGGGHGLATACFLAKKHGIRNVAVLEKGWIGGGNSGRNTQVTRSNSFYPVSSALYDHSLKLYEGLGSELNFGALRTVTLGRLLPNGSGIHSTQTLTCDALAVSGGFAPTLHLYAHAQGKLAYDSANGSIFCTMSRLRILSSSIRPEIA